MHRPDDEVRLGLSHDAFLVHDVLLLPRLHDVVFAHDLQRERPARVVVNLDLWGKRRVLF